MAKLLWQSLVGNDAPAYFQQNFTLDCRYISSQIAGAINQLVPIQQNLNWILDARMAREQEDASIGQGSWGEDWWLPSDQAAYLRQQIRRARPDLLQENSSYEDCMEYTSIPYFELVSQDQARIYVGSISERHREYVEIAEVDGIRRPLNYPRYPYSMRPGTGFSWGYSGSGPSSLAISILADAVDGDYEIANRLCHDFVLDVLIGLPQHTTFEIPRSTVLAWLETKGVGRRELQDAKKKVAYLKKIYGPEITDFKAKMASIRERGGLAAQRFDIVPADFECAVYLDLMHNLQRAGWVLRCSHCQQPIACPRTPTGNRQRARWLGGKPVYHEDCFAKHRLKRKRDYWNERMQAATFRNSERTRGRSRRKRT
jgi:hypothetical protein